MNRDGEDNILGDAFPPQPQDQDENAEVDDDPEDEDEDDDEHQGDENRVLDGGVAGSSSNSADDGSTAAAPKRRAADCDLILFITCADNMDDIVPNHPILKEGVVVSIGLDKSTKLGAVFTRYTEFCNENAHLPSERVEESDLEFFHCQLLNGNDTAESSALMKNDRIKVRRERQAERETLAELKRIQRESDKEYFKQLGQLVSEWTGSDGKSDLVIDCQGKHTDGYGRNQQVLATKVRGHSTILSKRCKWLGSLIQTAREDRAKRIIVTSEVNEEKEAAAESPQSDTCLEFPTGNIVANTSATLAEDTEVPRIMEDVDMEDYDDDEIGVVLPVPAPHNNRPQGAIQRGGAAEIENDDDNYDNPSDLDSVGPNPSGQTSETIPKDSNDADLQMEEEKGMIWVTLPNHPPDAVKILMEYCYTNRVISLGYDAFVQACKTKPVKPDGPVSPFSSARRWPNNGLPKITFATALAGIALAEEAGLPRLSLMCEVAASQLVTQMNCVEALSKCTTQKELTGNELPRLREIAISAVLRFGDRGVYESGVFRAALEGRTNSIIPILFSGTVEAIANTDKHKTETRKRNFAVMTETIFDDVDRADKYKRERERRNRRLERGENIPDRAVALEHLINNDDDRLEVYSDSVASSWASENARRSLKRMSHHLNVGGFNVCRTGVYPSRDGFTNRAGYAVRRRAARRRGSERS